jgi:glycosyltransferase involved in cell wall biosynthesis
MAGASKLRIQAFLSLFKTASCMKRLVIVPSDPIADYEAAGYDWLERYYNPLGMFNEVIALSPLEQGERKAHGMTIRGVKGSEFREIVSDLRPDVVRAYGGYWPADFVARNRLTDIPVIVSVHDSRPDLVHESLRFADIVMCTSKAVRSQVLARQVPVERTRILPNRVDLNLFKPVTDAQKLGALASEFPPGRHILHVGRKAEQKNLDTLIRALALLPENYSCVFVGKGERAPYTTLAREKGVTSRCFWVESVKNSELPAWYSWCDCMCTPSRSEGFGIVFIEAAACGAPIVTSDIPPMNEYLTADKSACLVRDYENPEALAQAIRRVCENAGYRKTISAGAIRAAEPFDQSHVDETEAAIYREAMGLGPLSLARRVPWMIWKRFGEHHG